MKELTVVSNRKLLVRMLLPIVSALFLGTAVVPCHAQAAPFLSDVHLLPPGLNAAATPAPTSRAAVSDDADQTTGAASTTSGEDDKWNIVAAPYLWFPGVHGSVGPTDRELSVHATPGDLLSHFRFGLMGGVEFSRKRLLLPVDVMWVRLGDTHPLPLEEVTSVEFKAQEFILTPKIGYRVLDQDKIKVDALTGFRFWHVAESLDFNPSALNFSSSENWADPLVGGRIQIALSPKVVVNILGDVGGWGAASQLDYQVVGLIGYKIKTSVTLQAGYRYMGVDYRNGGFTFNVITSGAMLGATMNLK